MVLEYFHHLFVLVLFSIYLDKTEDNCFLDTIILTLFYFFCGNPQNIHTRLYLQGGGVFPCKLNTFNSVSLLK